jgi:hypothetical protein
VGELAGLGEVDEHTDAGEEECVKFWERGLRSVGVFAGEEVRCCPV